MAGNVHNSCGMALIILLSSSINRLENFPRFAGIVPVRSFEESRMLISSAYIGAESRKRSGIEPLNLLLASSRLTISNKPSKAGRDPPRPPRELLIRSPLRFSREFRRAGSVPENALPESSRYSRFNSSPSEPGIGPERSFSFRLSLTGICVRIRYRRNIHDTNMYIRQLTD